MPLSRVVILGHTYFCSAFNDKLVGLASMLGHAPFFGACLIEFLGSPYPLRVGLPLLEGGVPPSFDQRFSRGARPCDEVRKYVGKT